MRFRAPRNTESSKVVDRNRKVLPEGHLAGFHSPGYLSSFFWYLFFFFLIFNLLTGKMYSEAIPRFGNPASTLNHWHLLQRTTVCNSDQIYRC